MQTTKVPDEFEAESWLPQYGFEPRLTAPVVVALLLDDERSLSGPGVLSDRRRSGCCIFPISRIITSGSSTARTARWWAGWETRARTGPVLQAAHDRDVLQRHDFHGRGVPTRAGTEVRTGSVREVHQPSDTPIILLPTTLLARLFPHRRAPPQFVEELQQEGHMDTPSLPTPHSSRTRS
jgi:hypothetical protein